MMKLDFALGTNPDYGDGFNHFILNGPALGTSVRGNWRTAGFDVFLQPNVARQASLQVGLGHPRMVSSFCTTDLTDIDQGAICSKSNSRVCAARNAVCEEDAEKPGKMPSYHCVCRPGTCGVGAGLCVDKGCTEDVAKAEGALSVGDGEQKEKAMEHAIKSQRVLDVAGDDEVEGDVVEPAAPKAAAKPEKQEGPTVDDESGKAPANGANKKAAGDKAPGKDAKKEAANGAASETATAAGKSVKKAPANGPASETDTVADETVIEGGAAALKKKAPGQGAGSPGDEASDETPVEEASEEAASASPSAAPVLVTEAERRAARCDKAVGTTRQSACRKHPDMNEMFAGVNGIMPSGGPDGRNSSMGNYKLKLLVPDSANLNGGSGQMKVGSDDLDPAIVQGLENLMVKLENAQKLQENIVDGWEDTPALPQAPAPTGDVPVGTVVTEGVVANPPTVHHASMPLLSLVGASLSQTLPGANRSPRATCEKCGPRACRLEVTAQWASFLSPVSQVLGREALHPRQNT